MLAAGFYGGEVDAVMKHSAMSQSSLSALEMRRQGTGVTGGGPSAPKRDFPSSSTSSIGSVEERFQRRHQELTECQTHMHWTVK